MSKKLTMSEYIAEIEKLRTATTEKAYKLSSEAVAVIKVARENGKPVPWAALVNFLFEKGLIPRKFKYETLRKKYQEAVSHY